MLVSCPKCESRYKLPDEKIRPQGTKVRCPRCQHTFHVHKEEAKAPDAAPFKRAAPPPLDSAFMEGAKTTISELPTTREKESKEPSPFKKAPTEKISMAPP